MLLDVGDRSYFETDPASPLGTDRRQPLLDNFYGNTSAAPNSPYPNLAYAPMPYEENLGAYYTGPAYNPDNQSGNDPPQFKSSYSRIVGGTTYHWLGISLRYLPTTFRERTLFDRGADWPLSYEELRPAVPDAGDPADLPGSPDRRADRGHDVRRAAGPGPGHAAGPQLGAVPGPPAVRRQRQLHSDLSDPGQVGCHDPDQARAQPGEVTGLVYKDGHTREDHVIRARAYVMCAHAMETAKILLMSPWGEQMTVANTSDAVGRYLMDHNIKITTAVIDEPIYPFRGPKATSGIETLRDGPFRRRRGGFRVEIQNVSANWALNTPYANLRDLLNANLLGAELTQQLAWDVTRTVQLDALVEPEGQWDSTIRPSKHKFDDLGVPRPEIHYRIDDYTVRGGDAFVALAQQIFHRLGAREVNVVPGFGGAGHVMGTLRMGDDPATSVTDRDGRTHDHPNLWLTGSGLFPTVDSANPTLTIAAVTLRQAERLIAALSG
ncbi:MAG TPA: GMC oxidoreductase [Kofleriaceae bacterium]|nr:GMC oxidoreductase [Kofleriaceae bacterium]